MTKAISYAFFAAILMFGSLAIAPAMVSADVKCGEVDPITLVVKQCGNGNPELVTNGYGVMNSQVPHVQPGQTVADAAGIVSTCPAWFGANMYCIDIFGTEVYKSGARALAKQLQAGGYTLGLYAYWLTH